MLHFFHFHNGWCKADFLRCHSCLLCGERKSEVEHHRSDRCSWHHHHHHYHHYYHYYQSPSRKWTPQKWPMLYIFIYNITIIINATEVIDALHLCRWYVIFSVVIFRVSSPSPSPSPSPSSSPYYLSPSPVTTTIRKTKECVPSLPPRGRISPRSARDLRIPTPTL